MHLLIRILELLIICTLNYTLYIYIYIYTIKLNVLDIIYYVSERVKLLLSYVLLYTIFFYSDPVSLHCFSRLNLTIYYIEKKSPSKNKYSKSHARI